MLLNVESVIVNHLAHLHSCKNSYCALIANPSMYEPGQCINVMCHVTVTLITAAVAANL